MKIYDCLPYCGEDLLLKVRFETLFKDIDKFVIVEGNKYFNGEEKPQLFNIKKFEKYKEKIKYYFIENFPTHTGNNYEYEDYQRNQIKRGFNELNSEDLILLSDADEIPNLKNKKFLDYDSTVFLQNMYYYKFNIHWSEGLKWNHKWSGTKSCRFKFFETVDKIRKFRVRNIPWWRFDKKIKRHVETDGGWHFTFLMNANDISKKLIRFDHEINHLLKNKIYNKNDLINIDEIKKRILDLKDPYNRSNVKLKKVKIDNTFPEYILKNIDKLSDYIV
jgi:beta-1,4-mannosyl-glycoprotein beta-1,4-N-acetylglucosaminyltransferase